MSNEYRFVPGENACDICRSMENTYPYPPHVPVHPNCDCHVEQTGGYGDCTFEIRNVESYEVKYSELEIYSAEIHTAGRGDVEAEKAIQLRVISESWDDPELKALSGWSPPSGSQSATFTLPGDSVGTILIRIEVEITQIVCKGEQWEVCRRSAAPDGSPGGGGFAHTLEERMIQVIGGGAAAVTGIIGTEIEFVHDTDDGHEPEDEVPV